MVAFTLATANVTQPFQRPTQAKDGLHATNTQSSWQQNLTVKPSQSLSIALARPVLTRSRSSGHTRQRDAFAVTSNVVAQSTSQLRRRRSVSPVPRRKSQRSRIALTVAWLPRLRSSSLAPVCAATNNKRATHTRLSGRASRPLAHSFNRGCALSFLNTSSS